MIGNGYWATGISVKYGYHGSGLYGWSAQVRFYDDGFAGDDNTASGAIVTEGTLGTRYFICDGDTPEGDGLAAAIDAVKADAERLGITWHREENVRPSVYCDHEEDGDGPDGWRKLVDAQSARLGWQPAYSTAGEEET